MAEAEQILKEMEGIEEPKGNTKRGKGRPKGSPNKKGTKPQTVKTKKAQAEKGAPANGKVLDKKQFEPLTQDERENLKMAIAMAHELIDDGLWFAGLDTDPDLGGMPIWALDMDELETVSDFIFAMADRRPVVNAAARKVITVYNGWKIGAIYATRVGLTVFAFMTYGFNMRFSKRAVKQEQERGNNNGH